ncbi:MAG TPA: helix-hairpin-helix domain-containing protein [Terriglobales bacterium]|nr:helix-hairpin-helix domain-containing protein [Terriglobales bacterium]
MLKRLLACAGLSLLLAGCTQQKTPDQIRQETAEATAKLKTNAKAVVQGVREGLKAGQLVDLNSSSRDDLLKLPGLTDDQADRIVAGRPYASTRELVSRRIIPEAEYNRIKGNIEVKK